MQVKSVPRFKSDTLAKPQREKITLSRGSTFQKYNCSDSHVRYTWLVRVCHVCIDYCFEMLMNKMTLPKQGLPDGRALLQVQLFQ